MIYHGCLFGNRDFAKAGLFWTSSSWGFLKMVHPQVLQRRVCPKREGESAQNGTDLWDIPVPTFASSEKKKKKEYFREKKRRLPTVIRVVIRVRGRERGRVRGLRECFRGEIHFSKFLLKCFNFAHKQTIWKFMHKRFNFAQIQNLEYSNEAWFGFKSFHVVLSVSSAGSRTGPNLPKCAKFTSRLLSSESSRVPISDLNFALEPKLHNRQFRWHLPLQLKTRPGVKTSTGSGV